MIHSSIHCFWFSVHTPAPPERSSFKVVSHWAATVGDDSWLSITGDTFSVAVSLMFECFWPCSQWAVFLHSMQLIFEKYNCFVCTACKTVLVCTLVWCRSTYHVISALVHFVHLLAAASAFMIWFAGEHLRNKRGQIWSSFYIFIIYQQCSSYTWTGLLSEKFWEKICLIINLFNIFKIQATRL